METLELDFLEIVLRLIFAMFLGIALGVERVLANKTAGIRTFSLVSLGSALFVIISQVIFLQLDGIVNYDPLRIASQVIVGIGFLGAGLIIHKGPGVIGLTTAAGMWVAAGIGMAAGFGLYKLAVTATFLTLFVFITLWFVEEAIRKWFSGCDKLKKEKSERKNDN